MNKNFNFVCIILATSKNCWVVLTQLWVKYGQTQPLGSIFLIKILTQRLGLSIFDKTTQTFLECRNVFICLNASVFVSAGV